MLGAESWPPALPTYLWRGFLSLGAQPTSCQPGESSQPYFFTLLATPDSLSGWTSLVVSANAVWSRTTPESGVASACEGGIDSSFWIFYYQFLSPCAKTHGYRELRQVFSR